MKGNYECPYEDGHLLIVKASMPEEFQEKVNALLKEGGWRVVQTEMSVCDHHYFAMLVKKKNGFVATYEEAQEKIDEMERALEFYAHPRSINASKNDYDGKIYIYEGGGTDLLGTFARAILAKLRTKS